MDVLIHNVRMIGSGAMKIINTLLMLSLVVCSSWAIAGKPVDLTRIVEQQRAIAVQLESSDAAKATGLDARQIETIRAVQTEVFATIGERSVLSELTADEQVRLKNGLEKIKATMEGTRLAELNREKCWREQKLGTTMKVTRCATQLELDQLREGARDWWEKSDLSQRDTIAQ
jgi:hypothetical protein